MHAQSMPPDKSINTDRLLAKHITSLLVHRDSLTGAPVISPRDRDSFVSDEAMDAWNNRYAGTRITPKKTKSKNKLRFQTMLSLAMITVSLFCYGIYSGTFFSTTMRIIFFKAHITL